LSIAATLSETLLPDPQTQSACQVHTLSARRSFPGFEQTRPTAPGRHNHIAIENSE